MEQLMRIGIDARFLTHPQAGGFKTYTKNLVAALAKVDSENEYVLYLDREPEQWAELPSSPNFTFQIVPGSMSLLGMPWREQISLARETAHHRVDLLHSPSLTAPIRLACPSVVTIHDMIWYCPERFLNGKSSSGRRRMMEWYYRLVSKQAARQAAAIITVSYAAKESITHHLGLSSDNIFVTYEAASHIYRPVQDKKRLKVVRKMHHLTSDFILAIGSADPRKNIKSLVQAYALLPERLREQYCLVIVWTHPFLADALAEQVALLGLSDRVHFLQQVDDTELVLLYNAATLFVFPSRYEGFGLPPLEAMACGTPVVAANNSSIPEIVGDAAVLVDAEDTTAMAAAIAEVLTDSALQTILIEKGSNRAASFSWENCARETLATYKQVFAE